MTQNQSDSVEAYGTEAERRDRLMRFALLRGQVYAIAAQLDELFDPIEARLPRVVVKAVSEIHSTLIDLAACDMDSLQQHLAGHAIGYDIDPLAGIQPGRDSTPTATAAQSVYREPDGESPRPATAA